MKYEKNDIRKLVHTPNDVASLTIESLRRMREYSGIKTFISALDAYLLPGRPGDLISIIARPGHFKTGFMMRWARLLADEIISDDSDEKHCIVYVTWEMTTEELASFDFAAAIHRDVKELTNGSVDLDGTEALRAIGARIISPVFVIGHDLLNRRGRPRLAMQAVTEAVKYIEDEWGLQPRAVFLDYLQQMAPPLQQVEDRRMQIYENVALAKDLAFEMGSPVVMGCQARREVDARRWKLPIQGDGMESSNIEHTSDKILTLWFPWKTEPPGSKLEGLDLTVTENLLLCGVQKQRFGPAGLVLPLFVRPGTNDIDPMETRREVRKENPNGYQGS